MADPTTDLDIAIASKPPRIFSRRLPVLGVILGISYFAILFLAGLFSGPEADKLPAKYVQITNPSVDMCSAPNQAMQPMPDGKVFIGYGMEPVRVLIQLDTIPAHGPVILSLDASVDRATFRACDPASTTPDQVAGDRVPFSARTVKSEDMAFEISPSPTPASYALEMVQNAAISQRLIVEEVTTFERNAQRRLMIRLAAYGALIIMILYNTILSFLSRNPLFAFNAGVASSMFLLDIYLSGFGPAYLWPEAPHLSDTMLAIGLAGPSLFGPIYLAHFLNGDFNIEEGDLSNLRRLDLMWPIAALVLLGINFAGFELFSILSLTALWITMTFYYAVRAFLRTQQGSERAAILFLPLFGAIIPAMVAGALNSWWQPDFGFMQDHLAELALVLETLTFTLALAYLLRVSRWREHEALSQLNLQSIAAKQTLLRTIDADRTRMAAELHDTAGQGLLLAASRLKQIEAQSPEIVAVSGMVGQTLSDLRSLSHDLHPATLEHLGLHAALDNLVSNLRGTTEARISYEAHGIPNGFTPPAALHIYRIAQELLANAITHAKASSIAFTITGAQDRLTIEVSDDGIGMGEAHTGRGIGSTIIRERVAALHGTLSADINDGTQLRVDIPTSDNLKDAL